MKGGELGKTYVDGEIIVSAGEKGDCMFVVQEGEVEEFATRDGNHVPLLVRKEGDFFGEMAMFDQHVRESSVRARGKVRVLTLDKRNFLRRMQEDPILALRILQSMARRVRELSDELARFKTPTQPD